MSFILDDKLLAELIHNSNLIENIYYSPEDTLVAIEDDKGPAEVRCHAQAYRHAKACSDNFLPKMQNIHTIHRMLTTGILDKMYSGSYRTCQVYVGNHIPPAPKELVECGNLFDEMITKLEGKKDLTPEEVASAAWNAHHHFETIHPYVDGNGRTGRVILNWISWHFGGPSIIVDADERHEYYQKIQGWRDKIKL